MHARQYCDGLEYFLKLRNLKKALLFSSCARYLVQQPAAVPSTHAHPAAEGLVARRWRRVASSLLSTQQGAHAPAEYSAGRGQVGLLS